mmetsp:Transcript_89924/g.262814  ORF Transcript_89924/g.262814 Transcript_89924/m.262814 type:complete len:404 (-) Transcript_89924:73-1284(-)
MAETASEARPGVEHEEGRQSEERDSDEESEPLLKHFGTDGDAPKEAIRGFGGSERVASVHQELVAKGSRYDWIVEAHAFQEYPKALCCARLTQLFLGLVVLASLACLIVYYALGVVQIEREYYWYDYLQVPTLVICPDWGRPSQGDHFRNFVMGEVFRGTYPSAEGLTTKINHTVQDCLETGGARCKCIGFGNEYLEKHEHGTDLVSVRFDAVSQSPAFLFGFYEPGQEHAREVPTFGYGLLKTRSLGYLTLHLLDVKDKKVSMSLRGGNISHFRDTRLYDWEIAGNAVPSVIGDTTELLFGFKTFQVARDQTFNHLWSPFAIATVVAMGMSLLNNLNIFGLVWPVQQHPAFTQREPSILLRGFCGFCGCMQRRSTKSRPRTRLEMLLAEHQEQMETPRASVH